MGNYVDDGYIDSGYFEGDSDVCVGGESYVDSGYVDDGYYEGGECNGGSNGSNITPNNVNVFKRFQIDIKNSSTKTKAEVLGLAKAEVERRQANYEDIGIYTDVYDARDKTITRVYSDICLGSGLATTNTTFGSGEGGVGSDQTTLNKINTIYAIATEAKIKSTNALDMAYIAKNKANAAESLVDGRLKPKLKLVSPFDTVIIDTELDGSGGFYTFAFDSEQVGNGEYHLELEFVEE